MKTCVFLFLAVNILLNSWHSESSCAANQVKSGDDCVCDEGFELVDGAKCKECNFGFVKGEIGNGTCTACHTNLVSNNERTDCVCDKGYGLTANGFCEKCDKDYIKQVKGNFSCAACGDNFVSNDERTGCICDAGYGIYDVSCKRCDEIHFKKEPGNYQCLECFENSVSNDNRTYCECRAGFGYENEEYFGPRCIECSSGTFKVKIKNLICTPCHDNSLTNEKGTDCACKAGFELNGTNCVECNSGFFKAENGNEACKKCNRFFTTESRGSTNKESCNVKRKGLIAGISIAVIIPISTAVI
ncbi:MAG: hypothetical protein MHPSP_003904, partial [Paramarteilia canceri]